MSVRRITTDIAARWLKSRAKQAHKGDAGRVYVVAGSRGMAGAAVLSAMGAVRSGAGLVRVGTVKSQQPVIARRAPLEVTSEGFPEDANGRLAARAWKSLRRAIEKFQADVIAVGPGLGRSRGIELIVRNLLYRQDVPVVLDADGLNALAALGMKKPFRAPVVITPHPGEMSRILGSPGKDRNAAVRAAALRFRAVALLKGAGTLVSDGRQTWVNTTGNPAMASGGMGDVLTGIVAASWGQMDGPMRLTALKAAALAAFVHGRAADIAVKRFPERTLLATDVAETLPLAFKKLWRKK